MTPSYDSNMLPKVVFDKIAFVKFKIINNFDEIDLKQPKKILRKNHISLWISKTPRKKSAKNL
jgi:hypothetical protein